jgi:hypothetical protein
MSTPSVRILFVMALAVAVTSIDTSLLAQNPITAAREAFRKAQEEARRKAQEEAQRRSGQTPAPGQPPATQPPASPGAPAAAPAGATAGGAATTPSGTPESTASAAKAAGFIDVGGLKLGMPLQAVEAAIRALNPGLKSQAPNIMVVWPYDQNNPTLTAPADAPRSVQTVGYELRTPQGRILESVALTFALHPNPAVVTNISRQVNYEQGKGPSIDTVIQSLRAKYGSESVVLVNTSSGISRNVVFRWLYESGNQPLRGNLAERLRTCTTSGRDPGDGTRCGGVVALDANVSADGNGIVEGFGVRTASHPLTVSAAEATDAYLRQVAEERAKRQRDESSQRAAPKL